MKKSLFIWMAAVVMGMTLVSCGEKKANSDASANEDAIEEIVLDESDEPTDQLVSLVTQFVNTLKSYHINSQEDADRLETLAEAYQEKMDGIQKAIEKQVEGMSDSEQLEYAAEMLKVAAKFENIEKDMEETLNRLQKEAEEAGVDFEDLDLD